MKKTLYYRTGRSAAQLLVAGRASGDLTVFENPAATRPLGDDDEVIEIRITLAPHEVERFKTGVGELTIPASTINYRGGRRRVDEKELAVLCEPAFWNSQVAADALHRLTAALEDGIPPGTDEAAIWDVEPLLAFPQGLDTEVEDVMPWALRALAEKFGLAPEAALFAVLMRCRQLADLS